MNPFDNAIQNLFNFKNEIFSESIFEDKECPKCKTRLSDLKETSFVGCDYCYKFFHDTIYRMALRYHGKVEHIGKSSEKHLDNAGKLKEIDRLEKLKKQAADADDFVKAAEYKQQIEKLKGEIK